MKLTFRTFNDTFAPEEDLESLVKRVAYPDAAIVKFQKSVTVGELKDATRVEFKLSTANSKEVNF